MYRLILLNLQPSLLGKEPDLISSIFSLKYFSNTISRLLLPVDGAHPSACEDMGSAVSVVEAAAHKGLLQCIDTVMSEVCTFCRLHI
jgi:hypothetical protein